jgi:hypothetical protein
MLAVGLQQQLEDGRCLGSSVLQNLVNEVASGSLGVEAAIDRLSEVFLPAEDREMEASEAADEPEEQASRPVTMAWRQKAHLDAVGCRTHRTLRPHLAPAWSAERVERFVDRTSAMDKAVASLRGPGYYEPRPPAAGNAPFEYLGGGAAFGTSASRFRPATSESRTGATLRYSSLGEQASSGMRSNPMHSIRAPPSEGTRRNTGESRASWRPRSVTPGPGAYNA